MHRTTILLPEALHALIRETAEQNGVSVSQFFREAALAIAYFDLARRKDPDLRKAIASAENLIRD